jgi:uncharacterized protein (TIGR03792 family)
MILKFCKSSVLAGSTGIWLTMAAGVAQPVNGEQETGTDGSLLISQPISRQNSDSSVAVEWLRIKVNPAQRQRYLQKDAEIWTPALKRYSGFIDKTVWLNPNDDAEVIIVVRWASREQWFAIPQADLDAIEQRFDKAFPFKYRIQEVREYQVL